MCFVGYRKFLMMYTFYRNTTTCVYFHSNTSIDIGNLFLQFPSFCYQKKKKYFLWFSNRRGPKSRSESNPLWKTKILITVTENTCIQVCRISFPDDPVASVTRSNRNIRLANISLYRLTGYIQ